MNAKENAKIWLKAFEDNRELMEGRVQNDIEKYRKGYCKLRFIGEDGKPITGKKVRINQMTHDFKHGAHIFMLDEFENPADNQKYRQIFKEYFNLATVPFYWRGLEPEQGKLRFDKNSPKIYRRPAPDLCLEYCEENGIDAKLHCLVYDKFTPDWLPKNNMAAMEKLYEERIRQISERYCGRLMEYEVINETLWEYCWKDQSVISGKHDVIEWAFALARKYLPEETLVINDGVSMAGIAEQDYRNAYFMEIEKSLMSGAMIDKVGLQYHIFTGTLAANAEEYEREVKAGTKEVDPNNILKALDILAELGRPLEMTEVTIPTFGESEEDEELQAQLIKNIYSVWFSHPSMNTIVYWNTVDGYAYVESGDAKTKWNENACRGGIFHHDLTPKKSALMMKKLFDEVWHTELELVTDENGCVDFRGFYGDYQVEIEDAECRIGLHKGESASNEIVI